MSITDPYSAAGWIMIVFTVLLGGTEVWYRLFRPPPERTRKFVHLTGGLACLLFPVYDLSPLLVLGLALALTGLFLLARYLKVLQCIHDVDRTTRGSEYYPLAIFISYAVTRNEPWIYVSSVLVLAIADACAGLVGKKFGAIHFDVEGNTKSLEGSSAFFIIAFFAIAVPGHLLSNLAPVVVGLSALLGAFLVTGFEFVSLKGTDNLFVPIALCVILARITTKPVTEIVFQNASLLVLSLGVIVLTRWVRSFRTGGVITYILFAYSAWSLGTPAWSVPVLSGFLLYTVWVLLFHAGKQKPYIGARTLFRAFLIPFSLLFFANVFDLYPKLLAPYLAAGVAVLILALRNIIRRTPRNERGSLWMWQGGAMLLSAGSVFVPVMFFDLPLSPVGISGTALTSLCLILLIEAGPSSWQEIPEEPYWPAHYYLVTLLSAGAGLVTNLFFLYP